MDVAGAGVYDEGDLVRGLERDIMDGDVPMVWDCAGAGELVAGEGVKSAYKGWGVHIKAWDVRLPA